MKPLCSFCGVQQALVYCKSDAARLCLICDAYVHAANALSHRHIRAQICDRCHAQPAASRCPDDYIALCDICDLSDDSPSDAPQRRVPIGFYSGCPTPEELLAIWFDAPGAADESCGTWEVPLEADLGVVSQPIKLEPVWTPSSASHVSSDSCSPLSCDEDQIPIVPTGTELPNASSLTHDFVAPLPPCIDATSTIVQAVNINADQLLMNLNGNRNINLAFPPGNVSSNMSLSLSSLTGESSGYGYQDCGVSPLFFATETSWDSNQEKSSRQLRYEAKMRYKEKKKIRLFGKQVRYAARKASADNRKRVKGRFVRAAGKFDHVPLAESKLQS